MIKPEQVPKEVVTAAYDAYWHQKPNSGFAEAIAAALSAWPGMIKVGEVYGLQQEWWLELPLPQEASDD